MRTRAPRRDLGLPQAETRAHFIAMRIEVDGNGCWIWQGARTPAGYGILCWRRSEPTVQAYRAAFEEWRGPIPDEMELDHLCRVRACVNPDHLEVVSHAENVRRSDKATGDRNANGSKTGCPKGHAYDQANTIEYRGRRYCRTCRDARNRSRASP